MELAGGILRWIILVAILLLIARFVIDWVQLLARTWRPTGFVAVICEAVYSVTDPPMRAVRRLIPPARIGGAAIDFSPMVLLIGLFVLNSIVNSIFP